MSANDQHPPVVTLASLHGRGGSVIGPQVAERLGVPFPDRAIPEALARQAFPDDAVADIDELPCTATMRLVAALGPHSAGDLSAAPTSAILAYDDQPAIGLIGALTRHGVRISDEVSVIGFDDMFASGLVSRAPATVAASRRTMGATAVTNLIGLIGGACSRSDQPMVLPVKLVVRASTAPRIRGTIGPSPGAGQVSGPAGAR